MGFPLQSHTMRVASCWPVTQSPNANGPARSGGVLLAGPLSALTALRRSGAYRLCLPRAGTAGLTASRASAMPSP